jgi:hypothetical protein
MRRSVSTSDKLASRSSLSSRPPFFAGLTLQHLLRTTYCKEEFFILYHNDDVNVLIASPVYHRRRQCSHSISCLSSLLQQCAYCYSLRRQSFWVLTHVKRFRLHPFAADRHLCQEHLSRFAASRRLMCLHLSLLATIYAIIFTAVLLRYTLQLQPPKKVLAVTRIRETIFDHI